MSLFSIALKLLNIEALFLEYIYILASYIKMQNITKIATVLDLLSQGQIFGILLYCCNFNTVAQIPINFLYIMCMLKKELRWSHSSKITNVSDLQFQGQTFLFFFIFVIQLTCPLECWFFHFAFQLKSLPPRTIIIFQHCFLF